MESRPEIGAIVGAWPATRLIEVALAMDLAPRSLLWRVTGHPKDERFVEVTLVNDDFRCEYKAIDFYPWPLELDE